MQGFTNRVPRKKNTHTGIVWLLKQLAHSRPKHMPAVRRLALNHHIVQILGFPREPIVPARESPKEAA